MLCTLRSSALTFISRPGIVCARRTVLQTPPRCGASSSSGRRFVGMNKRMKGVKETLGSSTGSSTAAGESIYALGRGAAFGAGALALGGLCMYSAGMSSGTSALDKSQVWPDYVRKRIRDTYFYFAGSLVVTAGSAVAAFRTPAVIRMVSAYGWKSLVGSMVLLLGSSMACQMLPYQPGQLSAKHLAWMVHSGAVGLIIAPLCLIGGPVISKAAVYTAGIVSGLSALAMTAPSDKFLYMSGPLAMGAGVVMASCIGTWFLPATGVLGASVHSLALYGGLVLFGGFMLYDTQKIMHRAEQHPVSIGNNRNFMGVPPYDPINSSLSIYMDTINIFIRMVMILAGGGGRKRK